MADAGVLKDSGRLPWLEPYRAPEQKRNSNRAGVVAIAVIALAGLFALFLWRDAPPLPADEPTPQTTVALPTPADMQSQAAIPPIGQPAEKAVTTAAVSGRAFVPRTFKPRQIAASNTDGEAFRAIVSEQIAALLLAPEPPPVQPAPAVVQPVPVQPLRPAVNPRAKVVKGKTVQLGVYFTAGEAEVAWQSAIRDYTYLVTMPKSIQRLRLRGKHYYRLQLGTPSTSHARQLCVYLHTTGRACTVA